MVFSDTTNKEQGIIQGQEWLIYNKYAEISGNSNRLAFHTLLTNNWLDIAGNWIQKASGEWPYDDYNHGNLPVEEYDFTDEQANYGLDTDIRAVTKVRIRDASTEEYSEIDYLGQKDWPEDWFNQTAGTPLRYYFIGRQIMFDPPPDTDLYDKYELTYDRDQHLFTIADTSATPGFNRAFHPILIYGPVRDWAMIQNKDGSQRSLIDLCNIKLGDVNIHQNGLYYQLIQHYSKQNKEFVPALARKGPSGGSWR